MHLHQYFEDQLQEILERHDCEQQRNHWEKTGYHEVEECAEVDGKRFHLLDDGEAVAEVGEGLNIASAEKGLVLRVVVLDPLLLKEAGICGGERAVLVEADALWAEQAAAKDDERKDDDEDRNDDVGGDRRCEVLQRNLVIDEIVGQDAGRSDGEREENDAEEALGLADEAEPAGFVGMRGKELEIELVDAVKKLEPEKQPPEPAIGEELK